MEIFIINCSKAHLTTYMNNKTMNASEIQEITSWWNFTGEFIKICKCGLCPQ